MATEPEVAGVVERQVTGRGGNPPGQGPFLWVTLAIAEGKIHRATYDTYQCPACHACGKAVTSLAQGRRLEEARKINWDLLSERVGPLPRGQRHCLSLALLALSEALDQLEKISCDLPGPAGPTP